MSPLTPQQPCADTAEAPWPAVFRLSVCLALHREFDEPWTGLCLCLVVNMNEARWRRSSGLFLLSFPLGLLLTLPLVSILQRGVEALGVGYPTCCFRSSSSIWIWCLCVCQTASRGILSGQSTQTKKLCLHWCELGQCSHAHPWEKM